MADTDTGSEPPAFQRDAGYRRTLMDLIRGRKSEADRKVARPGNNRPATHMSKQTMKQRSVISDSLGSKEEKALLEFKNRVKDLIREDHDDYYLTKWLRARCFDVGKAETMFKESMQYREKMKVDTLLDSYTPPKVLQQYLTGGFCGFDKEGSPVRVELFGYLDMKGIIYSSRRSDLEKTKLLQCETTVRVWALQSAKYGRRVDGLTVIFDMENVGSKSLWRPGLQMYLHLVKILEDNYPEMMKRMFVVNAPRIFPLLWKICRPLISEDMKNKIHVLDGGYQRVLLEYIDAEELPAFLGGNKTDADGDRRCSSLICQGGEVPRSLYLSQGIDTENMDSATIPKADKLSIDVDVQVPGSVLRWEFMTEDFDISFGIVYKNDKRSEEVVAMKRIDCHMIPEEGHMICQNSGTYMIRFDNSYSWTRAKKLFYSVELHTSDPRTDCEVDQVSGGCWTRLSKGLQTTKL